MLLCACHPPGPSHFVPDYPQREVTAPPTEVEDSALEVALDHYARQNSPAALQMYRQDHPGTAAGRAVEKILELDRLLSELRQENSQQTRSLQECRDLNRKTESRAAKLKEQLDALAESLIQQEKRLP